MIRHAPATVDVRQARERKIVAGLGFADAEHLERCVHFFGFGVLLIMPNFLQDAPPRSGFSEDTANLASGPALEAHFEDSAEPAWITARLAMHARLVKDPRRVETREDGGDPQRVRTVACVHSRNDVQR